MGKAKEIIVKVIPSKVANGFVKKHHYSGKIMNNSKLHFGAFLERNLHGVMSFGPPIDKRKVLDFVKTDNSGSNEKWNEMLELNRMAFDEVLPKNSESRCISIAVKLIKKQAPHVKWILSFADGVQCGDGTIYRASGFNLLEIRRNKNIKKLKTGEVLARHGKNNKDFTGSETLPGYQFCYVKKITKDCEYSKKSIPFSKIDEMGAGMYRGKTIKKCGNSTR